MNYEQKYKQALNWMASLYPGLHGKTKEEAERFFPELKESRDERIRKRLIAMCQWYIESYALDPYNLDGYKEALAWLEKQESVGEIVERCKTSWYNEGKIQGQIEGLSDDEKYQQGWHDALEKQGFCSPFDYEHANIPQKDFSPKVTSKIEPKFKVGDWIVSSVLGTARIIDVNDSNEYLLEYIDGKRKFSSIDYVNYEYDKWSIQDAKDVDVLTVNGRPFIYCCNDDYEGNYCCIDSDGVFRTSLDFGFSGKTILPATKEQRDLLFQKMREAGYGWDAERK